MKDLNEKELREISGGGSWFDAAIAVKDFVDDCVQVYEGIKRMMPRIG